MASQWATADNLRSQTAWLDRLRGSFGVTARKGLLGLLDQALVSGTSFLTTVIIGRTCGLEQLGLYSLGFSLLVMIAVAQEALVCAPYTVFAARFDKQERAQYTGNLLGHCLLLAAMATAGLVVAGWLASPAVRPLVWLLAAVTPFMLLREFARRQLLAHLRVSHAIALDLAVCIAQLGLLMALVLTGRLTAATAYACIAIACAFASLLWLVLARRELVVRWQGVVGELRRSWDFSRWVFAAQFTSVVDKYIAYWIVAALLDATATGVLAACMMVIQLANPLVLGVCNIFGPRAASAYAAEGMPELARVTRKVMLLLGTTMLAFALAIGFFGGTILQMIYGEEYAGMQQPITILAVAFAISAAAAPAGDSLRVIERTKINFLASIAGMVVSVSLIAAWVGPWGIQGAAWGFVAGAAVIAVIYVTAFERLINRPH